MFYFRISYRQSNPISPKNHSKYETFMNINFLQPFTFIQNLLCTDLKRSKITIICVHPISPSKFKGDQIIPECVQTRIFP